MADRFGKRKNDPGNQRTYGALKELLMPLWDGCESEYNFSWEGRLKLTWEETGTDEYNRALLFTYEDVGDWDFFVVINDGRFADETVRGAFTKFVYRW